MPKTPNTKSKVPLKKPKAKSGERALKAPQSISAAKKPHLEVGAQQVVGRKQSPGKTPSASPGVGKRISLKTPVVKVTARTLSETAATTRGRQKAPTTARLYDPTSDNTVRVRKAGEIVAERFRKQIAQGTLSIGHQLPSEEELTTMFGIARTTLREALRVLESQGLLEIKRGRGGGGIITMPRLENLSQSLALVLQLQQTTSGDLDEARMMIEPPLAGRLAAQHSDEDLDALNEIVEKAHQCAESNDRLGFGKAASALHEAVISRGRNNTMAVVGALLHDLMDRHLRSAAEISDYEQMSRAVRSYRKLIDLIASGDAVAASAHWHRQLVYLQQRRASIQLLDIYND